MAAPPVALIGAFTVTSPTPPALVSAVAWIRPEPETAPLRVTWLPARRLAPPEPEVTPPPSSRSWTMPRDSRRTEAAPRPPEALTSEPAVVESSPLKVVMSTVPPAVVMSF